MPRKWDDPCAKWVSAILNICSGSASPVRRASKLCRIGTVSISTSVIRTSPTISREQRPGFHVSHLNFSYDASTLGTTSAPWRETLTWLNKSPLQSDFFLFLFYEYVCKREYSITFEEYNLHQLYFISIYIYYFKLLFVITNEMLKKQKSSINVCSDWNCSFYLWFLYIIIMLYILYSGACQLYTYTYYTLACYTNSCPFFPFFNDYPLKEEGDRQWYPVRLIRGSLASALEF